MQWRLVGIGALPAPVALARGRRSLGGVDRFFRAWLGGMGKPGRRGNRMFLCRSERMLCLAVALGGAIPFSSLCGSLGGPLHSIPPCLVPALSVSSAPACVLLVSVLGRSPALVLRSSTSPTPPRGARRRWKSRTTRSCESPPQSQPRRTSSRALPGLSFDHSQQRRSKPPHCHPSEPAQAQAQAVLQRRQQRRLGWPAEPT